MGGQRLFRRNIVIFAILTISNAVVANASRFRNLSIPCFAAPEPKLGPFDNLSRRDILLLSTGGLAYGKLVGGALSRLTRGDRYPPDHEDRVRSTFRTAVVEAARAATDRNDGSGGRPLRVLEVGVGSGCRAASRGLYGLAMNDLSREREAVGVALVGIDLEAPKADAVSKAREVLSHPDGFAPPSFPITFDTYAGDLNGGLSYADGNFDCVICVLTLCSVLDQAKAIGEIHRLVNPKGGTFGYVEHVAVNMDEEGEGDRGFMDWQQRSLDPLQQRIAHNCHLHRDTDRAISDEFNIGQHSKMLQKERFFVEDMWPVNCQSAGVVQRLA